MVGFSPFSRGYGPQKAGSSSGPAWGSEGKAAGERQFRWAQRQGALSIPISQVGEP